MSDDEDYAFYGDPLEPLDNDNYYKQKAPKLEDQIVTDNEGRRRFHGAFTGGFSAGYFNTVGTKEGWTPATFSSSRVNRTGNVPSRTAVDFMDDEDLEAHGIAPQGIKTKTDFEINERPKRKRITEPEGPIPGNPVLSDLLVPIRETVGIKVLKKFGWKPGQGIGPRVSRKNKRHTLKQANRLYGCQGPPANDGDCNSSSDDGELEVTFAPSDQSTVNFNAEKDNLFGIGYKPMARPSNFGLIPNPLRLTDNKKKLAIAGHAFGVGAFEDDDDDIYGKEDLSSYDFSLGPSMSPTQNRKQLSIMDRITDQLEGFVISAEKVNPDKIYQLPMLPSSFIPIHTPLKIRRFNLESKNVKGLGRHELSAKDRGRILSTSEVPSEIRTGVVLSKDEMKSRSETQLRIEALLSEQRSSVSKNFQPYSQDAEKQKRYELYCRMEEKGMKDRYHLVQPKNMTEWEKARELSGFERSHLLFKPLVSSMAARFTRASGEDNSSAVPGISKEVKKETQSDVHRDAAKTKMYGKLTLTRVNWHPDSVVCKRFFVTNPYTGSNIVGLPGVKHEKVSIFNFLEAPIEETAGLQIANCSKQSDQISDNDQISEVKHTPASVDEDLPPESNEPPTMDLFKAIFQDSDTDSDKSDEEVEIVKMVQTPEVASAAPLIESSPDPTDKIYNNDALSNRKHSRFSKQTIKTPFEISESSTKVVIRNSDLSDRIPSVKSDSSNRESCKKPEPPGKIIFKKPTPSDKKEHSEVSSSKSRKNSSGIFSNIDFQALNEYRNTSVTPAPDTVVCIGSTDSDDEEYGPVPPLVSQQRTSHLNKDYVREKSKKEKKKSKHKKHKKEKKKHKHKS